MRSINRYWIFTCLFLYGSALWGAPPRITVHPDTITAGSHQSITFTAHPGDIDFQAGSGIRIEIPVAYLETGPYYWDPAQQTIPDYRGYVTSRGSRGTRTETKIYGNKNGVIECRLADALKRDEQIIIEYSGVVQSLVWPLPLRAQWRPSGESPWQDFRDPPRINITPHPAAVMTMVTPADIRRDDDFELAVVLLDRFGNRAVNYRGTIRLKSTDQRAQLPSSYTFTKQDSGICILQNLHYKTPGFQRIEASDGQLNAASNFARVSKKPVHTKRYFGDTHYHTGTGMGHKGFTERGAGGDHRGHFTSAEFAYQYARDVMRLDFASSSEHDSKYLDETLWAKSQDITDSYYRPGRFTTFYAYEWTAAANVGHNVILYKDRTEKVLDHFRYPTKPDLWNAFDQQNIPVIMIPHPMWAQPDHEMWNNVNDKYRTIGEIYSLWCTRFLLQPAVDVQRFELGPNDPWSFQYAWAHGHKIGVIGSSDNHTAHPGMNNYTPDMVHSAGLAVVLAAENTRDAIWESMHSRHTYATTGTRIWLDFSSDGYAMGSSYSTSHKPRLSAAVAGTNSLEQVDIVKFDGNSYTILHRVRPESETVEIDITDHDFNGNSMYYLRVRQVNEIWKSPWAYGTAEMAWSSPIWVEKDW